MRKKIYGQSRIDSCPFCDQRATTESDQGVPVCFQHKHKELPDMKCACGKWLDMLKGKYGVFFSCISCGNISWSKAMELNPIEKETNKTDHTARNNSTHSESSPKEIVIRSDELDFI